MTVSSLKTDKGTEKHKEESQMKVEAEEGARKILSWRLQSTCDLAGTLISHFHNSRRRRLCCFKAPPVEWLVMATLEKKYTYNLRQFHDIYGSCLHVKTYMHIIILLSI